MQESGSGYSVPCVLKTHLSPCSFSTGLEMNNTKTCRILEKIFTVTFENTDDFYKRGLPYTGTVMGVPGSPTPCLCPVAPAQCMTLTFPFCRCS